MSFILGNAKTYRVDIELFKSIGISTFETDSQKEFFVGEYSVPDYDNTKIKIWVTCRPAQFWRFQIATSKNELFEMSTGSGALSEYWDTVFKIATDMIVIKQLKP